MEIMHTFVVEVRVHQHDQAFCQLVLRCVRYVHAYDAPTEEVCWESVCSSSAFSLCASEEPAVDSSSLSINAW